MYSIFHVCCTLNRSEPQSYEMRQVLEMGRGRVRSAVFSSFLVPLRHLRRWRSGIRKMAEWHKEGAKNCTCDIMTARLRPYELCLLRILSDLTSRRRKVADRSPPCPPGSSLRRALFVCLCLCGVRACCAVFRCDPGRGGGGKWGGRRSRCAVLLVSSCLAKYHVMCVEHVLCA